MTNDFYYMDYIPNKTLFKAVMFSRKMIRDGLPAGLANCRAAKYYGVNSSEVARYVGQVGSTCSQISKRMSKKVIK